MAKKDSLKGRFALFCDYAFTTSDRKLSMVGEFNQLFSTSPKPVLNRGFVVGSFDGPHNKEYKIVVSFYGPSSEKILSDKEFNVDTGDGGRINIVITLTNVVFNKYGEHSVRFILDNKELCRANLMVSLSPQKTRE